MKAYTLKRGTVHSTPNGLYTECGYRVDAMWDGGSLEVTCQLCQRPHSTETLMSRADAIADLVYGRLEFAGPGEHECPVCSYRWTTRELLAKHVRMEHLRGAGRVAA